ncbi:MAG: helix-turn-helix transcriptional regulator [Bacilli bacterium]|nr:helix-turn-helix transcriptional regulator [Bacilli bacterium]MBQ9731453.1 helix-turn-helix transcriptional regulator [Bacilli bacterium]
MDQEKIGKFIAECRRRQKLTQFELAEKLSITDRAVSKWETGRGMPDSSLMLDLCKILEISVNDLLSGEVVTMNEYNQKQEQTLLDLVKQKEENDKKLLALEVLIGIFSIIILLGFTFTAAFAQMESWLRIVLIVLGFIISLIGIGFALRIEQTAGYYECRECRHKYIPTFSKVLWAMHYGRTRYMRCPSCGKYSWNKKVIKK